MKRIFIEIIRKLPEELFEELFEAYQEGDSEKIFIVWCKLQDFFEKNY